MKKLSICGDSWMTPSLYFKNTHFSELLAEHYGVDLLALSRNSCSNNAICLQIEESIRHKADFVIVGCTTPDRIEIPLLENTIPNQILKSWHSFFGNLLHGRYNKEHGLANIDYSKHAVLSAKNKFLKNPVLISESIQNLIWQESIKKLGKYKLSEDKINSLIAYVSNLYDPKFKQQIDCWCISNALRKLQDNNINFLFFSSSLFSDEFLSDISWMLDKNKANIDGPYNLEFGEPTYHTTPEAQVYVADQLIKIIDERF